MHKIFTQNLEVDIVEDVKKDVIEYLDKHEKEIVDFLVKLIQFKSISYADGPTAGTGQELEIQEWLRDELTGMGFDKVDFWAVDKDKVRPNVVATIKGEGKGKSLIFNGHVDVVKVTDEDIKDWTVDPWNPVIKDGMVYGRGANDMKGGVTSMIWAAKALIENDAKLEGDLYVECEAAEESVQATTIGTNAIIDRGYTAPLAVVQEPTNCEINTMSNGLFAFELDVRGKAVHSSCRNQVLFPQRYGIPAGSKIGVDAIAKAIPFIEMFERLEVQLQHRWQDKTQILGGGGYPLHEDHKGVGIFGLTPSLIEGGTYVGAVAGYCKVTYCVFHPPWVTAEELCRELKGHVDALASTDDWLAEHPPKFNGPLLTLDPMKPIPIDHEGVKTLRSSFNEATGKTAILSGVKYVCDATVLTKRGIPTIIFGPGSVDMGAHGPDEHVPIQQVVDVAKTDAIAAINWCRA
jgi:acetylornithine deacetylase/succinyl-diaminopimelate desuccinylase family protein